MKKKIFRQNIFLLMTGTYIAFGIFQFIEIFDLLRAMHFEAIYSFGIAVCLCYLPIIGSVACGYSLWILSNWSIFQILILYIPMMILCVFLLYVILRYQIVKWHNENRK